ncbi:heavy metal-associated isoprenylated plant protein 47 [Abeliophyllum distichum]|uniref:Heavy metal-associated isoprenylated plant protein 47 n=1 Tax=Abeliophyllum distichum TaxID=126358 RepID=A0ABD1SCU5_9LAMI
MALSAPALELVARGSDGFLPSAESQKVVIEVTVNGQTPSYQGGIIEMLFKFMCCVDEESDHATRIRTKAKKIAVSIPGVDSVAMEGVESNNLVVTGEGFDVVRLVNLLRKKV